MKYTNKSVPPVNEPEVNLSIVLRNGEPSWLTGKREDSDSEHVLIYLFKDGSVYMPHNSYKDLGLRFRTHYTDGPTI